MLATEKMNEAAVVMVAHLAGLPGSPAEDSTIWRMPLLGHTEPALSAIRVEWRLERVGFVFELTGGEEHRFCNIDLPIPCWRMVIEEIEVWFDHILKDSKKEAVEIVAIEKSFVALVGKKFPAPQ